MIFYQLYAHLATFFDGPSLNTWGHCGKNWEQERKTERDQSWGFAQVWCSHPLKTWWKTETSIKDTIDFYLQKTGYTAGGLGEIHLRPSLLSLTKWWGEQENWEKPLCDLLDFYLCKAGAGQEICRKYYLCILGFKRYDNCLPNQR